MKKLLLIALLTVAMIFTVVACEKDPPKDTDTSKETIAQTPGATDDDTPTPTDKPEDPTDKPEDPTETPESPTETPEPPTETPEPPTETPEPPTETPEPPTETPEPPTEKPDPDPDPEPIVKWDVNKDVVTHQSFDELRINGDGGNGVFAPGQSATWDYVANLTEGQTYLDYWGWIGAATDTVGQFGYAINGGEIIYNDAFAVPADENVQAAAAGTGALTASRMLIKIDLAGLEGENAVVVYYKGSNDKVCILNEFTVNMPELPDFWDENKDVVTHLSFDELRINGGAGVFAPGQSAAWDGVANLDGSVTSLYFWGWIDIVTDTVGEFGYKIDNGDVIYNAGFTVAADDNVIGAAAGTGALTASRMGISIDLADIYGEHTVTVYYKGTNGVCILNEFTVIKAEPAAPDAEDSHEFISDIGSQTANAPLELSDLTDAFAWNLGNNDGNNCLILDGYYQLGGINAMATTTNGKYALSINIQGVDQPNMSTLFFRGVRSATPEKQYYGTDKSNAVGGSGIYLSIEGENAYINIKSYDGNGAYLSNVFKAPISGEANFTVADSGETIYIMESGNLIATISVSGTKDYGIATVASDALAEKVSITLADGSVHEVANPAVAASHIADVGITARASLLTFTSLSLMPFSSVEIPGQGGGEEKPEPIIYNSSIDFVNGSGPNGSANYAGLSGNSDNLGAYVDAFFDGKTVGADMLVSISGWFSVSDGVKAYVWSVDGENWYPVDKLSSVSDASGGLADHFANTGYTNATANGVFSLMVNLKDYSEQTIDITFAAVPNSNPDAILNIVTIEDLEVPTYVEADPNAPALLIDAAALQGSGSSQVSSVEVLTEGDVTYAHITPNGGDPWIMLFSGKPVPCHMVICYRTTSEVNGQFFAGYGGGPAGPDTFNVDWNNSGNWETMYVDISTYENLVLNEGMINYSRFDFFTQETTDTFDVAYIAYFETAEAAKAYMNGGEPEVPPIVEGDPIYALLDGTYYVLDQTGYAAAVTLTIAKTGEGAGTLTIASEMFASIAGDYSWTYTTEGGLVVDGLDILLGLNQLGNPMVQFAGLPMPLELVSEIPATPDVPKGDLVLGENAIDTPASGTTKVFVAELDGTYIFSYAAGEANGEAILETADGSESLAFPYSVTLKAGESFTFIMYTINWKDDVIDIVISLEGEEEPELPALVLGDNEVAVVGSGAAYTFSAKAEGTYVFSWGEIAGAAGILTDTGIEEIAFPYEITLGERETITLVFATADWTDGVVNVTVAGKEPEAEDDTLILGDNEVAANGAGIAYTFSAKAEGTYVFNWGAVAGIAIIETANGSEEVSFPYEVTLGERETFTIILATADWTDGVVNVTVAGKEAEEEDDTLILGDNEVAANGAGIAYTFSAKAEGTYVFNWGAVAGIAIIETANGSEEVSFPYEITLGERETFTIILATADWTDGVVNVTVAGKEESSKPSTPAEIVDAAYALADGETLAEGPYTLTGVITSVDEAFNSKYSNITVTIAVDGAAADKVLKCYRLAGEGAELLIVGDTITVTGELTNYQGTIEFAQGCTLDSYVLIERPEPEPEPEYDVTISFDDTANRTELSTEKQVWVMNGITVTGDKAESTSDIKDYSAPARFYKGSNLTIAYPGMTQIYITCASAGYASALANTQISAGTVAVKDNVVIVTFDVATDSVVFTSMSAQTRIASIGVI